MHVKGASQFCYRLYGTAPRFCRKPIVAELDPGAKTSCRRADSAPPGGERGGKEPKAACSPSGDMHEDRFKPLDYLTIAGWFLVLTIGCAYLPVIATTVKGFGRVVYAHLVAYWFIGSL